MAEIGSEAGTPERPADAIVCQVTSVIGVAGMPEFNSLKMESPGTMDFLLPEKPL